MIAPHWPGGAIAEPLKPGEGEYMVDSDGLIIGWASDVVYLSPDELQKQFGESHPKQVARALEGLE